MDITENESSYLIPSSAQRISNSIEVSFLNDDCWSADIISHDLVEKFGCNLTIQRSKFVISHMKKGLAELFAKMATSIKLQIAKQQYSSYWIVGKPQHDILLGMTRNKYLNAMKD